MDRHTTPEVVDEGYSIEFFYMTGTTVTVGALEAAALRPPTAADWPTVRALSA